jgi:nucleoside-diphosphate-sugar epimerase
VEKNIIGTIRLIETARRARLARFILISTCAVHDKILDDRALDETHPLWPTSHYGAHKAALEAFVHSYGFGHSFPICALRPTGIYGLAQPAKTSKWFDLVSAITRGEDVMCRRGGKVVHASDVARAAALLLSAEPVAGEAFSCYDRYISEFEVATLARELAGSRSKVQGEAPRPRHQIVTTKLQALGMRFGGLPLLKQTIAEMIDAAKSS